MDWSELRALLDALPDDMAALPGSSLYSPLSSVRPGPAYLMGLNPGGDPARSSKPIRDTEPATEGTSPYTHELWRDDVPVYESSNGVPLPEHRLKPHQRRVIALAKMLGYPYPATLPSANLIFGRSSSLAELRAQTGHDAKTWACECWKVHQALLSIIRPSLIVSLGYGNTTSPLGLLMRWGLVGDPVCRNIQGHGPRRCGRVLECTIDTSSGDLTTTIIGIPHPSWSSVPPCVAEKIQAVMRRAPPAS